MLHDCYISTPIFGPNAWNAIVEPANGGGLPSGQSHIVMVMKFKDGGAYEFHSAFERIRDRFHQVMGDAGVDRPLNSRTGQTSTAMAAVNMGAVHLDELPTYEASGRDELAPQPEPPAQPPIPQPEVTAPTSGTTADEQASTHRMNSVPTDAPPGYEEVQRRPSA